ncbi:ABC transporter permease [Streptomyces collinus]|uniref:Peptide/nickel transport system permease protein n=2 Tax=Streptomyces TaxID=1883 RepID=A0AA89TZP0_STRCU|nr:MULTISPECIES: ABC transporter permease [Streptomyces]MBB5813988.1 peptide/nickel transport system permease protein [Streptomyces collinus]MEC7056845.1 ABC transporter permease [Streptomyces violaceochromogenes]WMX67040.1 ABC transporter permease [Streptomyces collinus]
MAAYILRRVMGAVLLLLVVSAVTFAIFFLVPRLGGQTADQLATQYVGKDANPESVAAIKQNLGLDLPVYEQYWNFIKGIVVGADYKFGPDATHCDAPCFGYSFKNHVEVWPQLLERIPVSLSLAVGAAVIWVVFGVLTGVVSALRKGKPIDRAAMFIALAGVSLPIFFTGQILLALFVYEIPIWDSVDYVPFTENPADWAWHLVLPWVSLAFLFSALYARLTRAGMLETMSEDYIRTARAKGLTETTVVAKHGLRSALTPIVTIFGMDFGILIGSAVLTETVFSLQGIGAYAIQSIQTNDLPIIMGVTMVAAFFIVFCNLIVDLVYAAIDPRVRYS